VTRVIRGRFGPLTFAAGLLLGGVVAITVAAEASSSPPTYYGCLHKGTLSKIGTRAPTCPNGHKLISWNSVGPQGAQGVQGLKGQTGPMGLKGDTGPRGATGASGASPTVFTASGTYDVPAGVTAVQMVLIAGGGGGGNTQSPFFGGGGGGQGGAELAIATVAPGTPLTITVGAGGLGEPDPNCLGSGATGGASAVADGATTLASVSGGVGGVGECASMGATGGAGGAFTTEPGVITTGSSGVAGSIGIGGNSAGGGLAGAAGSGGEGGLGLGAGLNGLGGSVEITPVD
jgi:hypothetical protein